jgi:uncharacterized protein YndB with AHSA1/START domain
MRANIYVILLNMNNFIAEATVTINAEVSDVWKALVDPELIKQYLFGSEVVTDWKEGSPVIYKGTYQGKTFEDKGVIVTVEPEKLLIMTHWSPLSGTADVPENYHTVEYNIISGYDGTHVSITQDKCASEEEQKQNSEFWSTVLQGLKKLLEK